MELGARSSELGAKEAIIRNGICSNRELARKKIIGFDPSPRGAVWFLDVSLFGERDRVRDRELSSKIQKTNLKQAPKDRFQSDGRTSVLSALEFALCL